MATETTSAASQSRPTRAQRSVWRPEAERRGWWRSRLLWRWLVLGLFVAMIAALAWLVFPPLYHPTTQLVFLTGGDYRPLKAPPAAFALEDYEALEPLRPALYKLPVEPGTPADEVEEPPLLFGNLSSAADMRGLSAALADVAPDPLGVVIIYIDAHGVSDDSGAYLLCRDYDPANPAGGKFRVAELLRQISDTPAKAKLVILDAGRLPFDPRLGMLANEFPRRLAKEVREIDDPTLWVLSSNRPLERSHVSSTLERSVFGYFVSQGLHGAADLDGRGSVDVDGLYRFVRAGVASWVQQSTGGLESQTPVLLWGGGETLPDSGYPVILPTLRQAGSSSIRLPSTKSVAFPPIPDSTPATAYVNSAQQNYAPVVASSQKKVPGVRQARKAAKVKKRVSRRIEQAQPDRGPGAGDQGAKPGVSGDAKPAGTDAKSGEAAPKDGDATKKDAAEKTGAASPSSEKPASDKPASDKPATAADKTAKAKPLALSAADLLIDGWQLRDDLETNTGNQLRVVDYAPAAWREYQLWLLGQEQLYGAGDIADQKKLARTLDKTLGRLDLLPSPPPLEADRPADLAARIAAVRPRLSPGMDQPQSLAMAQLYADYDAAPLSEALADATKTLDGFTHDGTPAQLAAWLKKLDPALDRYSEIRFARQVSKLVGVDWPLVQLAIGTRRSSEVVASIDPTVLPWIHERVEAADRLRLDAERLLVDGIDKDRQAQALNLLRRANDQYRQAADDAATVAGAMQFRNDLLNRAPFYVSWRAAAPDVPEAPKQADILELLRLLGELEAALAPIDSTSSGAVNGRIEALIKLTGQLTTVVDHLDAGYSENVIATLTGPTPGPASALRIDALLSTPLVGADARARLLGAAGAGDRRLAAKFQTASLTFDDTSPRADRAAWQAVCQRAELEVALARLITGADSALLSRAESLSSLAPKFDSLSEEKLSQRWQTCREFGAALADFYHNVPEEIATQVDGAGDLSHAATRGPRLAALHDADRKLRLIDIRDAGPALNLSPAAQLTSAGLYDLLVWQEHRLQTAVADAPPPDVAYLTAAARSYAEQATRIPRQPTSAAPAVAPLVITGPTAVNLSADPEQSIDLVLQSTGAAPTDVWVVLELAPELLAVDSAASGHVYLEHQLRVDAAARNQPLPPGDIVHPDQLGVPATFHLRPGASQSVHCKVTKKSGSKLPTKLIAKAISTENAVRHEIEVTLPAPQLIDLIVDGRPGSSTFADGKLSLFPFPNRKTDYKLSLVNNGTTDRTVDVELLALDSAPTFVPPTTPLAAADAERVLARLGPAKSLAVMNKVALPSTGKPVAIPFPGPPADKPAPPPEEGKAPPRPAIDHGLLVLVTDLESKEKTLERIDIAPQKPRRYVRPQVGYDLDRETLRMHIAPIDGSLLPPGPVKVHAEILPPLSPAAQTQLDAELTAPDYAAELFAEVPADSAKTLIVRLSVDGYPRAFVYHVPCGIQSRDVPEQTDLRQVRITSPAPDKAYKAPIEIIPVEAQVDAPLAAFQTPDDVLEIGIDVDRDRDLRAGEPSLRMTSDREVKILLDPWTKPGLLTLEAMVSDFHLSVPAPALKNARVSVLGRIFSGGKTGWSLPVDVLLDGAPPIIERAELLPPIPVVGPDVEVSVWASDGDLSGVDHVEAAFDPVGHGKFDDLVEPVELFRDETGRWAAKLPTKNLSPGDISLIARATDKVGNKSEYFKTKAHLITKKEADAVKEAANNRLAGVVVYGDKPWPQVDVTLTADKGPKIPAKLTDANGAFTFADLPAGTYKLSVKATIHNKVRKAEQEVTVEPGGAVGKPVRVVLK